jgi:5-formyltetrahydrofolate cyclo-ligase
MDSVMAKRSSTDGDDGIRQFASPACLMHQVDPVYMGLADVGDPERRGNIMRWRKSERARLIAARLAIPADERAARGRRLAGKLDALLPDLNDRTVSLYWPLRGEPDLRDWLQAIRARGAICALPVVVERNAPMIFRTWRPGEPIVRDFWSIPVPEQGVAVSPDIVLAPVVGFDEERFRLGYGGGYFDRTLASLSTKPYVVGIGYTEAGIKTIYPLDHDIRMDAIVT